MITQLNPPLPVIVTSKDNAKGLCHFIVDYGPEHHVLWGVALADSGEVWWVPNTEVRMEANWSMGRR